jgi:hypothetical protein
MEFLKTLDRAIETTGAKPDLTDRIKARVAIAADNISRAGHAQAQLDVVISSMWALITILYERDADGTIVNYERSTGRILIPLPWGAGGWKRWGLRKWEAACLRRLLLQRVVERRRQPPLFDYASGRWFLNIADYPTEEWARQWLTKEGPRLAEWRTIVNEYRDRDLSRKG